MDLGAGLLCIAQDPADRPCRVCPACRKAEHGNHPDLHRIQPEGAGEQIRIGQVQALITDLALMPMEGRVRVAIIEAAHRLNPDAQNALLKTLEEPPPDTTLVLVAGSADALLPTIRSRCLRVAFGPIPDDQVVARLVAEGRSEAEARLAVALAAGSLGRALALDPEELAALRESVRAAAALDPDDALGWLAFARIHGEDRERAGELCELLAVWLRDVLAAQAGAGALAGTGTLALWELAPETRRLAAALSPAEVVHRRAEVTRTAAALLQNASPVLAIERLLLGWFHGRPQA